jgi:hypothetical protein
MFTTSLSLVQDEFPCPLLRLWDKVKITLGEAKIYGFHVLLL